MIFISCVADERQKCLQEKVNEFRHDFDDDRAG